MRKAWLVMAAVSLLLLSCTQRPKSDTLVVIIESSPANLDPRVGTDAQSERIGKLIFDSLVRRDEHFNLQPSLAERWEIPDPRTYIFHLRRDVRFHDGTRLTARDVKWTLDSMRDGTVLTPKASTFKTVDRVEAPDEATVIVHLTEPNATLLWNVSDGAVGIVPFGSGKDFNQRLVGTGPFKFVRAVQDSEVVIARNDEYWGDKAHVTQVRFAVVPDATTRALELRKGSADIASNALSADMTETLRKEKDLLVQVAPGTIYSYLAFNLRDPLLKDVRIRQALAYAIDREAIIRYLWRGLAEPADSVLPPQHWAYEGEVQKYPYDPARARRILEDAGYRADPATGVRFHLVMKTSTEETTRLMAAVFQQQLREVGIALDIRTFEFATFYSDVVKGAFQMYSLRWIGGNEDPDIFEHIFHSASFPPKRANRSYYANPKVDALIDEGRKTIDPARRKQIYSALQKIVAGDLPYVHLWYLDSVLLHNRRVGNVHPSASGNYDFLLTAELAP
ncbi:MAG: ABC transporter substrate-binding protein [Acidobacteriales bacterium]|nr:ABC transporter substrate-binding protein [Terriglobales bacterium]